MTFYSLCKLLVTVIEIMTVGLLMRSGWLIMCAVHEVILTEMDCLIMIAIIFCLFSTFINHKKWVKIDFMILRSFL